LTKGESVAVWKVFAVGLYPVLDELDGDVARELEALVADYPFANLAPAVLDYRADLDARKREGHGLDLEAVGLHHVALEHVLLLQLDGGAVGLDGARGDVLYLDVAAAELDGGYLYLALRLRAALVKNLDADVVVEYGAGVAAAVLVGDAYFPEERLGVGLLIDRGGLHGEVGRVYRLPVLLAASRGARGREGVGRDECEQQANRRKERAGACVSTWGLHFF
jgi:hypothetical protein